MKNKNYFFLDLPMMPSSHTGNTRLIPSLFTRWLKSLASIFFFACLLSGGFVSPLIAQTALVRDINQKKLLLNNPSNIPKIKNYFLVKRFTIKSSTLPTLLLNKPIVG